MLKTSILSLTLRGLTLISKFVLLLFIARFLTPDELGIWGLMNVTIAMSLLFLGLDFYIFNTREILSMDVIDRVPMIRDQIVFHSLVYLVALPLLLGVFFIKLIAWKYVGWFYGLLILEHISQESYRLLITLSRPTVANCALFLRSGIWVFAAIGAAYYSENLRSLTTFWSLWIVGVVVSIGLSIYVLRHMPWRDGLSKPIDWDWLKKGVRVALPFFMATMSFMGIQFADRYFLQYFWGEATGGIYTFYANITNTIHTFIVTGIVMIIYPRLVEAYQKKEFDRYKSLMRTMSFGIVGGLIVLVPIAALLIDPVLELVGKQVYAEQSSIFTIMLGTITILCLSYIPHYALFVRHRDRTIIISTIIALVVAMVANGILVPKYGLTGAAYAAFFSMATLFLIKLSVIASGRHRSVEGTEVDRPARQQSQ